MKPQAGYAHCFLYQRYVLFLHRVPREPHYDHLHQLRTNLDGWQHLLALRAAGGRVSSLSALWGLYAVLSRAARDRAWYRARDERNKAARAAKREAAKANAKAKPRRRNATAELVPAE